MHPEPNVFDTTEAQELYEQLQTTRSLQPVMKVIAAIPENGPIDLSTALRALAALEVIAAITARRHAALPQPVIEFLSRESPTIWPGARFQARESTESLRTRAQGADGARLALVHHVADNLLARFSS